MVALILTLTLLLAVASGCAVLFEWIFERHRLNNERVKSLQVQRAQMEALNAIQLSKAWEQALQPNTTPQLEPALTVEMVSEPPLREDYGDITDYHRAVDKFVVAQMTRRRTR